MNTDQMPTFEELSYAPQLAALAALDFTLEAATKALYAAHRELCQDEISRSKLVPVMRAYRVLNLATKTQVALVRYRQAVSPNRSLPPDTMDDLDALSREDCGPSLES